VTQHLQYQQIYKHLQHGLIRSSSLSIIDRRYL